MDWNAKWITVALFGALIALSAFQQRERLVPEVPEGSLPGDYVRLAHHSFASGVFSAAPPTEDPPQPEAHREPLLPWLVAGLMHLDSDFAANAARCVGRAEDPVCLRAYRNVPRLNLALHLGAALLVGITLLRLGVGRVFAGLGLWLVGTNARGARFMDEVRTESLAVFAIAAAALCLTRWAQRRTPGWALASGVSLGLLALTKAQFLYLIGPLLLGMLLLPLADGGRGLRRAALCSALCALGFVACVGPWMARNQHHFGGVFIVDPVRALPVLSARVHYDRMTPEERRGAWVYWGDRGIARAERELPLESYARLDRENPDGYHAQSKLDYKRRRAEAREGGASRLEAAALVQRAYLEEIRGDLGTHLEMTILVTYRLLHGDSRWRITFPLTLLALGLMLVGRRWEGLFALAPCLFSIAFHGLTSHGKHRYGIPAVPGLAVGAAFAFHGVWGMLRAAVLRRRAR